MATRPSAAVKSAITTATPPRRPLTSADIRAKYARVVQVPKPPKRAYNPNRPVSGLIENQIRHLQLAEWKLQREHRSRIAAQTITTERQASAYIQHVTSKLHPAGAVVPRVPSPPSKRRKATRRKPKARKASRATSRRRR
jgi:hypothetical protein